MPHASQGVGRCARDFYLHECVKENWSVRQLDRQINTLFYDRLLASRDKKAVKEEISRTEPGRVEPKEIIRDPYILEFLGIRRESIFWKPIWSNCSSAACSASCSKMLCKGLHNNSYANKFIIKVT